MVEYIYIYTVSIYTYIYINCKFQLIQAKYWVAEIGDVQRYIKKHFLTSGQDDNQFIKNDKYFKTTKTGAALGPEIQW